MNTTRQSLDRRSMLRLMGGAGALAATGGSLAACSDNGNENGSDNEDGSNEDGSGNGNGGSGNGRVVVATVSEVSPELDSDAIHEEWFARLGERAGIDIEFRSYPFDQYENSVQLLFSQDDPPDVFRSAGTGLSFPIPYVRGWVRPLDEFVTDEFRARWPEGALEPAISGLHIGEELYGVPFVSTGAVYPLYCNMELLERYGGVSEPPRTWSEFEEVATRISAESGGDVAGFYPLQPYVFQALQATAGPDIGLGPTGLSLATGQSEVAAQQQVAMMEMLQRMNSAGAFITGWEAETDQAREMWSAFVQDQVAMTITTNWHYREMTRMREDLPLVIAEAPVPDTGRAGYQQQPYVFLPFWHMSSSAQDPEAAWQVLDFLSSGEAQIEWYSQAKRNPPPLPRSEYEDLLDEWDIMTFEVKERSMRLGPAPTMKGVDAAEAQGWINEGQPQPTLDEMRMATLSQPESDYEAEALAYDDENNENITAVLERAEEEGLDVTRETFTFDDWDPLEDYAPPGVETPDWG